MVFKAFITTSLLILAPGAFAAETDQFTGRYEELRTLPDEIEKLDAWVNESLDQAALDLEPGMPRKKLYKTVARHFVGPVSRTMMSRIEVWLSKGESQVAAYAPQHRGIYDGTLLKDARWTKIFGMSPTIKVAGVLAGEDKYGHYFSQGYDYFLYYESLSSEGTAEERLESVREYGHLTEIEGLGYRTDGTYSVADLAANWAGFRFWLSLFDGESPYFMLRDGKWVRAREFTFATEVTDDWDEAMNPSHYLNERMASRIQRNIDVLCATPEYASGKLDGSGRWAQERYQPSHSGPGGATISFRCD